MSTRNLDLMRAIGGDHVIDYPQEDFTRNGQQYDFFLDNGGKHSLADLRRVLSPTGMLVPNGGGVANRWFASAWHLSRAT